MTGSRARPHCLAEATATRCQRSWACASSERGHAKKRSLGHHRHDARDARHRCVAHDAVHLVPLEHGLDEDRGHRRLGARTIGSPIATVTPLRSARTTSRVELMAVAVEHGDLIAGGQAHDPNKVMRLVVGKDRLAPRRVEARHIEARTRHRVDCRRSFALYSTAEFVVRHSRQHSAVSIHIAVPRSDIGKYKILAARQRRLRHRLPRAKTPGSTRRSRSRFRTGRASTSASCCASRACSPSLNHPNIVTDPHRREAGQRLLHRDGVRAGRDARERSSRATARSTSRARSTTPARSATPSTTRTGRASSTATCGRQRARHRAAAC